MQKWLERWIRWVVKHSLVVILAFVPLTAAMIYLSLTKLEFATDYTDLISDKLPFHKRWKEYKRSFPDLTETIVIVISGDNYFKNSEIKNELLKRLKDQPEEFPAVFDLSNSDFFLENFLYYADQSDIARALQDMKMPGTGSLSATPNDPRLFLEVKPRTNFQDLVPAAPAIEEIYRWRDELSTDEVTVGVTGVAPLTYDELSNISQAVGIAGILAFLLSALILFWALGSIRLTLYTLICLVVGLAWTGGFAALAIGHLNMISIAFAVLFIGLGIDYSLHLSLRYRELLVHGVSHDDAIVEAFSEVGQSLWLCALTTCAGFYAFIPTQYQGVVELGIISGTGMFINFLIHITLFPALIHCWPHSRERLRTFRPSRVGRILGDFIFRRSRAIQWTAVAMALGSIFLLPRVRFDANPLSLQDPSTPAFQVYESLFDDPTKSPWTAKVVATSEEEAEAIAKNLKNEALVSDVVWVNTFLPPNQKERLAWLKQVTGRSYPALEVKDLPQDLRSRYLSDTGLYRLEVFPKENLNDIEAMRRFSDVVLKVAPNATDDPITIPATADAIVRSFMVAGILALCLTLFILFTALRNWVDTLLALLPLVLGGLYTVAFMQIIGSDFNFANIIVLPLLMGIAMDSGIHVIHKYRQSVKENPIAGSTSRALFFSAIVNISSFGTLAIANHRGMASMGLLLSVGMTLMLSCTFVVLPAMLKNLHRVRRQYLSAA